jgi:hypothetical protein
MERVMENVKIIASGLPDSTVIGGIENNSGKTEVEKNYRGVNARNLPELFSKIGEIEGYFEALATLWCDGELTLVIEKGSHFFSGVLTTYEDNLIERTVKIINRLAVELSQAKYDADSYKITYKFSRAVEFNDLVNDIIPRH